MKKPQLYPGDSSDEEDIAVSLSSTDIKEKAQGIILDEGVRLFFHL